MKKALTLQAPYGSFVAHGWKTVETRSWKTDYRGPLYIHQGRAWYPGWLKWFDPDAWQLEMLDNVNCMLTEDCNGSYYMRPWRRGLPLGVMLAKVELVDCVRIGLDNEQVDYDPETEDTAYPPERRTALTTYAGDVVVVGGGKPLQRFEGQQCLGDFTPGRYAWLLTSIEKLVFPVPAKGAQRIWEWAP